MGTYPIINADKLKLCVRLPVQRHVEVAWKDLPFRPPVVEFHKVTSECAFSAKALSQLNFGRAGWGAGRDPRRAWPPTFDTEAGVSEEDAHTSRAFVAAAPSSRHACLIQIEQGSSPLWTNRA